MRLASPRLPIVLALDPAKEPAATGRTRRTGSYGPAEPMDCDGDGIEAGAEPVSAHRPFGQRRHPVADLGSAGLADLAPTDAAASAPAGSTAAGSSLSRTACR